MAEANSKVRRKYEVIVILHPDASEDDQKALFRRNAEIIKNFKGSVNHLDTWGKRKLGNSIDRITRGNYFHSTFEAEGEAIAELERTMRINDKVLRFQHTRLDDRVSLTKFVEKFKEALVETANREREREIKNQQRKAMRMSGGDRGGAGFERGERGGGFERGERSERGDRGPR